MMKTYKYVGIGGDVYLSGRDTPIKLKTASQKELKLLYSIKYEGVIEIEAEKPKNIKN